MKILSNHNPLQKRYIAQIHNIRSVDPPTIRSLLSVYLNMVLNLQTINQIILIVMHVHVHVRSKATVQKLIERMCRDNDATMMQHVQNLVFINMKHKKNKNKKRLFSNKYTFSTPLVLRKRLLCSSLSLFFRLSLMNDSHHLLQAPHFHECIYTSSSSQSRMYIYS